MNEQEKQNRAELFKLMQANPDLPVVPMVDCELAGNDFGRYIGSWGSSYIAEYVLGEERVHFRDDDDASEFETVLSDIYGYDVIDDWSDEEWEKAYKELPWIKAIIVDIDLPEI